MTKRIWILVLLLLAIGFAVRLYRFDNPIADWHSWRQADVSAVSRNFVKYGFDLLHPRMNNISNVQSGLENPQGYFFTEFPLYNALQAGLFVNLHILTLEEWGRIITIFSSLLGSFFLFLIVKRNASVQAAFSVFIFALFLPFNVYYGRTILPDSSMIMAVLGGIYFFDRWLEETKNAKLKNQKNNIKIKISLFFLLSILFLSTALLLKPYAIFYALPLLVLAYSAFGYKLFFTWQLWIYILLSLMPLVLWRKYILSFPEGIPANAWLFNGSGIRFRPAFFRWIFYERITKLIGGYLGIGFIALGIAAFLKEKKRLFFLSFPIGSLLYLCIFATGNVQHDYYQIVIMPTIAILMGFGVVKTITLIQRKLPSGLAYVVVGLIILVSFLLSWQQVKDYFNINNYSIVIAGKAVDKIIPKDARIIAPYDGDSSFLYQTNRQGWASLEHDIPKLIANSKSHKNCYSGHNDNLRADFMVLINPNPQDYTFVKPYTIVLSTKEYLLVQLHK